MPTRIRFSVCHFSPEGLDTRPFYSVVRGTDGERLPGKFAYSPKDDGERARAQLMAGAYAQGFSDCQSVMAEMF